MKKFQVFTRKPHKATFDFVYEGTYEDDEIMTYDEMVERAKEPKTFWMPGAEFIVVAGNSAVILRAKMEYDYVR